MTEPKLQQMNLLTGKWEAVVEPPPAPEPDDDGLLGPDVLCESDEDMGEEEEAPAAPAPGGGTIATAKKKADDQFALFGKGLFGDEITMHHCELAERHIMPPFTVFDARQQPWMVRKRQWLTYGIESHLGREEWLTYKMGINGSTTKTRRENPEEEVDGSGGTSTFDPVLCELLYRWFCPRGGLIIDPFAGGSVRGIVASYLDRDYYGFDISAAQIAANVEQATKVCKGRQPTWIVDDSSNVFKTPPPKRADFLMACPPYGSLEKYSNDPDDLSNMPHAEFMRRYAEIILKFCSLLHEDRFAAFVVGDFRDKATGRYMNFPADTIKAFLDAGLYLYNEAILLTSVGSLAMRATKQFNTSRKLGKSHQNILVFVKGDPRKATAVIEAANATPPS